MEGVHTFNQIIHHEKSKYQDVLVFESSDYGTVLVLDNVIQCTDFSENQPSVDWESACYCNELTGRRGNGGGSHIP
jgi:hypothetical protein